VKSRWKPFAINLLYLGMLASGCATLDKAPSGEPTQMGLPQQEFYDATISFYQDDKLSAVMVAGRIRKFERDATILLDSGLVMDFYDKEGKHSSKLWADSGRTDETQRNMVAMGHVKALSDSGQMLETSILRWDNRTREIRSDARVKFSTPTDTLYGIGFVSDENLHNKRVDFPTGVTFRTLEKKPAADSAAVPPPAGSPLR
jgi:LPS export ABC transporter protein LptC